MVSFYIAVYIEKREGPHETRRGEWKELITGDNADRGGVARAAVGEFLSDFMKENQDADIHHTGNRERPETSHQRG